METVRVRVRVRVRFRVKVRAGSGFMSGLAVSSKAGAGPLRLVPRFELGIGLVFIVSVRVGVRGVLPKAGTEPLW